MEAPTYPPSQAYEKPASAPYVFGIDTVSVAEAAAIPELLAILTEEAPQMKVILKAPQVQAHVSNWSIRSLHIINLISADALAKIEKRMLELPDSRRVLP